MLVDVGNHLHIVERIVVGSLHPYGLPDTCCTGIDTTIRAVTQRLLTCTLSLATQIAVSAHHQIVALAIGEQTGNIISEGRRATEVTTYELTIDIDLSLVVDCTKVKHNLLIAPICGCLDRTVVPDASDELLMLYARELTFGAERNGDFLVKMCLFKKTALDAADAAVKFKLAP